MEMVTTQSHCAGQIIERGRRVGSLDKTAGPGGCLRVSLPLGNAVRLTTVAGAKSSTLGLGRSVVKCDVLPQGQPRRTGRAAIDAGCRDRIDEMPLRLRIALSQRKPALLIGFVWAARHYAIRSPAFQLCINHALTIQQ